MINGPVWPTKPYDPTAIRLYGINLTDITDRPNINISFLNQRKCTKNPVSGLSLNLFRSDDPKKIDAKAGATAQENAEQSGEHANGDGADQADWRIAVIYSYAFEGHCYSLDKPKIMVFEAKPDEAAIGCGYETFHSLENPVAAAIPYDLKALWRMWLVDRLDRVVEFSIDQGFFEELILEANKPGKRSPSTYAAHIQMAHRGGRLTD